MSLNDMNDVEMVEKVSAPYEGDPDAGRGGSGAPPAGKPRKTFIRASGALTDIFVFAALLSFLMLIL